MEMDDRKLLVIDDRFMFVLEHIGDGHVQILSSSESAEMGEVIPGISRGSLSPPESTGVLRSPGVPGLSIEGFGVITDYLIIEMGWVVPGPMVVTGMDQLCPARRPGDVVTSQNHTIGTDRISIDTSGILWYSNMAGKSSLRLLMIFPLK